VIIQPPAVVCVVERVTDGDTIRCADGRRVRLLGIDAPEMSQRPFGQAARRALQRMTPEGSQVTLEVGRTRTDRYGRVLAVLRLPNGTDVNERLVAEGFAVRYLGGAKNDAADRRLARAEEQARSTRAGLWANDGFRCSPREHRRKRC
jgi:micrococcal nuclease